MKESVTYQAIVEEGIQKGRQEGRQEGWREGRHEGRHEGRQEGLIEGQVQEARRVVLKIGTTQFKSSPNPDQLKVLESIREPEKLENLMDRLLAG
jgi:predicted transposase YdaD